MTLKYPTPAVPPGWAESRQTHPAIAMAIHAISDSRRTPEAIWESRTEDEIEDVRDAVSSYLDDAVFQEEEDGRFSWGVAIMFIKNSPEITTRNIDDARDSLELWGGWLLDLGDGFYRVTKDESVVLNLRGEDFLKQCEAEQEWDETRGAKIAAGPRGYL
jgi:hypothetical protein